MHGDLHQANPETMIKAARRPQQIPQHWHPLTARTLYETVKLFGIILALFNAQIACPSSI
jgi:hypothetical protein